MLFACKSVCHIIIILNRQTLVFGQNLSKISIMEVWKVGCCSYREPSIAIVTLGSLVRRTSTDIAICGRDKKNSGEGEGVRDKQIDNR